TDGGLSSVSEALSHNVPMIVVPQGADQPWIAQRVADLGAGQQLSSRGLTARRLRRAADQILAEPAYAAAAARIGETLRGAGGYQRAADEIEAFKRSHGLA
ncbi:MAG TPA: nucleotide disphospho-sugar-binding domain-containing protein, partial [Chloroflexota bacterium]|nr:nucleotide disphospho-sugar-binding domain-containing protein [Chloroflexota bacterium]